MDLSPPPAQAVLRFDLAAAARGWMPPRVAEAFARALSAALGVPVRETGAPPRWAGRVACTWAAGSDASLGPVAVTGRDRLAAAACVALDEIAVGVGGGGRPEREAAGGPLQVARFAVGEQGEMVALGADAAVVQAWWARVAPEQVGARLQQRVEAVTLSARVTLGRRRMSLDALSEVTVGDVLLFGPADRPVELEVGGARRFLVVPVRRSGRVGARVVGRVVE